MISFCEPTVKNNWSWIGSSKSINPVSLENLFSIRPTREHMKKSTFPKVLLNIYYYINHINHGKTVNRPNRFCPASRFLIIVLSLACWHLKQFKLQDVLFVSYQMNFDQRRRLVISRLQQTLNYEVLMLIEYWRNKIVKPQ